MAKWHVTELAISAPISKSSVVQFMEAVPLGSCECIPYCAFYRSRVHYTRPELVLIYKTMMSLVYHFRAGSKEFNDGATMVCLPWV